MPKRCCARPTASWRARTAPGSSTPPPITTEMRRTNFRPPRIGFVTVTGVEVSADLSHAAVRVSVMGSDEEKARSLEGLASAAGFLRAQLARRLTLRTTPELRFQLDRGLEHAQQIDRVLKELKEPGD